ncbi:MAG TPA: hypothetical protein VMS31_05425, partial [Pyrinomonadaceae bacterium]|nr:hypothetical protein [Pyrinomonadaceae bacterium]
TAGKPARIILTADRTSVAPVWDDLSYIKAEVVDEQGVLVPGANDLIAFAVLGPGVVAAVDNGNNSSHELFQANHRRAHQGRCFAMIKATAPRGEIKITGLAPGLASGVVMIQGVPVARGSGR